MNKIIIFTLISFLVISTQSLAQFDIFDKVKEKVEEKAEEKIDEAIDKGVDEATEENEENSDEMEQEESVEEEENVETVSNKSEEKKEELKSFSKFDFVPGEQVILFEDFSQDAVGDFPALWNTNGSAEVVTTNLYPGKWLEFKMYEALWTDQLLNLPENYTIEFDVIPIKGETGNMEGYTFRLIESINERSFDHGAVPGNAGFAYFIEYFGRPGYRTYINTEEGNDLGLSGYKNNENLYQKENQKYHISIWIQKSRVRLYQDETKLFDLPKAFPLPGIKLDRIRFEEGAAMISNIRIAVGAPDTRNKLLTEGKLVTRGILFDVNSDKIKPESYGTLKEIADVLKENSDLKVRIIGHTDSDGNDEANLDLSKRRSASVKNALANEFGIDSSRMDTDGKGESEPVSDNNTAEGKANNRRVEFIKI